MGIAAICKAVFRAVAGIKPRHLPGFRFRGTEPGHPTGLPANEWVIHPARETRDLQVRVSRFPTWDAGQLLKAEVEVCIVYRIDVEDSRLTEAEDVGAIVQILRDPTTWGGADTLVPGEAKTETVRADGKAVAEVVRVPVVVYFREGD